MLPSEGLNHIIEDPASEWGDDPCFEEDDDLDEELDLRPNLGSITRNHSSRPDTTVSADSQLPGDSKRLRPKYSRQPTVGLSGKNLKRDPTIESIIETRKSGIIENAYTRLAQTTSQVLQPSQISQSLQNARINSLKRHSIRPNIVNQVHFNDNNDQIIDSENVQKTPLISALQFDNDQWDDGLNSDVNKEIVAKKDKSSLQIYEDTCKRLNICPCSMIVRSLYTKKINLENYGLGAKGSAALAVALVRNTNVSSLNLAGNNIGSTGMSHIYQILTENTFIEEYNLSYNNLGTKGICKLAEAAVSCLHLRTLNIAGNGLTASDINILLSKFEDHRNLKDLNISHNQLDEEGGIYVAKWLSDNNVLLHLDISWCSIRLMGARAIAKAIGDNNKLLSLDLSNNSFTNDTIEFLINSLTRNMILQDLNLSGNEIFCRYDTKIKNEPSSLTVGKKAVIYRMFVAAATNQALKIFRLGKNHLDARCIMIMLESLSKLDNMSLEELDLTGSAFSSKQISDLHKLFANQPKFICYVGPIKQTVEQFANNLLNLIHVYCQDNRINLTEMFGSNEEKNLSDFMINYNQFRDGLRKAKIPFPAAKIENIIKYLGRDDDDGTISYRSLELV